MKWMHATKGTLKTHKTFQIQNMKLRIGDSMLYSYYTYLTYITTPTDHMSRDRL